MDWFDAMEREHPGWVLHNSDEVYDHIDDRLNVYLQKQVADGDISKETAEDIFEEVSTEVRTSSSIKSKVDDMIAADRVTGGKKEPKVLNTETLLQVQMMQYIIKII